MNAPKTLVILGSARVGGQSEKAAKYVLEYMNAAGFDVELIDVAQYVPVATTRDKANPKLAAWAAKAATADAFVIVSPEYNHGYPGELKLMLDMLTEEYVRKPIAVCGVSNGGFGGSRLIDHIKPVLMEMGFVCIKRSVNFSRIQDMFDDAGAAKPGVAPEAQMKAMADELMWFVSKLR